MSIVIKSGHSIKNADVYASNNLYVNYPTATTQTGYSIVTMEADDGSITGTKTIRALNISEDYRSKINLEMPLWNDSFGYSIFNNYKYRGSAVTQTTVLSGGFLTLNANNTTTSGTSSIVQTFKTFTLTDEGPLYVNIKAKFSTTLQNNSVTEFGLGLITSTSGTPTDGIFFRATGGTLTAVVNKGGYETVATNVQVPLSGIVYDYLLAINEDNVEFWINDVIVTKVTPVSTTGSTSLSNALPLLLRNYNTGTISSAINFNIAQVDVLYGDLSSDKNYGLSKILMGQSSINAPDGTASTANIINSLNPSVTDLANTTAGYTTLGGDFQFTATTSAETDYILFAYLNPVATSTVPGKTLVINNAYINTYMTGATITGTPTLFQWSMAVGGTAISLTEQDSVTAGTRAPRRFGLGIQSFALSATTGSAADRTIIYEAPVPIMIEAGSYCHIILKAPISTVAPSLVYRGVVVLNGYFE